MPNEPTNDQELFFNSQLRMDIGPLLSPIQHELLESTTLPNLWITTRCLWDLTFKAREIPGASAEELTRMVATAAVQFFAGPLQEDKWFQQQGGHEFPALLLRNTQTGQPHETVYYRIRRVMDEEQDGIIIGLADEIPLPVDYHVNLVLAESRWTDTGSEDPAPPASGAPG